MKTKKSPASLVHAAALAEWIRFKEAWLEFRFRYRRGSTDEERSVAALSPGLLPASGCLHRALEQGQGEVRLVD